MCILEDRNITLETVMNNLILRLKQNEKNIARVKKLYHDENSFNELMNQIIIKDHIRFDKFMKAAISNNPQKYPTPWNLFSTLLDIIQNEGEESPIISQPNDKYLRRNIKYLGWTFYWIHGKGTLVSIYNRDGDLIYQF